MNGASQYQPGKDVKEDLKNYFFPLLKNINRYKPLESNKFTDLTDTYGNKTVTFARPNDDQYQ